MNSPLVSVIILNWNGFDDTLNSIESSLSQTYQNCSVVVVDNGSTDGSLAKLHEYNEEKFLLISSKNNYGFAGGVNLGLRCAKQLGANYLLLLNNDAVLLPDAISNFVEYMEENPDIGISGGVVLNMNDDFVQVNGGRNVNYITGRCARTKAEPDFISGALMFIRSSVLDKIGLFSEDYFMYWEDVDFSIRAKQVGWNIGVCKQAVARHKAMASTKNNSAGYDYYFTKSSVVFFSKFGYGCFWLLPVFIIAFRKLIKRGFQLKAENMFAVLSAVKDGLLVIRSNR